MRSFNHRTSLTLHHDDLELFENYPVVVAVVAYADPTGQVQQFAPT